MWEIREYRGEQTIWAGTDAEGRKCYAVTTRRHGMDVEPTGSLVYYSVRSAREAAKEMAAEAAAS